MDDTGPPYPPPPENYAGTAPIGSLIIGKSQVGDVRPFNVWRTIISQYANSSILTKLITSFQDAIDQTANFENFFDKMWNVYTAQGYGLDCWGTIVAVNRVLQLAAGPRYFGFELGGLPVVASAQDYDPFNQSPLYSGEKLTTNYLLSDDGFRVLILAKAFANICNNSAQAINRLLLMLFGSSGRCYVRDNLDMTMDYVFEFALSPVQSAILTQSGVFPKPVGVSYSIIEP